ncbi:hypothetical protein HU200_012938 [Digitaria exilis]|uniref:Uncharacterized protein n=1 Tax=Digitaria exilis TaxID=1010633 RepID=A0A835FE28_9POAL|nr:hypothetical protein HU200_012938 [Digitaria exilis]
MSKATAAASLPPPPPEVAHLVDQLQRHHLAPDASLLSNSAHSDLLQAREEVAAERARSTSRHWNMVDYQRTLARRLKPLEAKCDALADLFSMDGKDSIIHQSNLKCQTSRKDDLKKTWLIKRCRTMNAKLSYLEHHLLRDTYTKGYSTSTSQDQHINCLCRKYLVEATKEASNSYIEAISRLREYQGVDPHFDVIARQYHEIVKVLWQFCALN